MYVLPMMRSDTEYLFIISLILLTISRLKLYFKKFFFFFILISIGIIKSRRLPLLRRYRSKAWLCRNRRRPPHPARHMTVSPVLSTINCVLLHPDLAHLIGSSLQAPLCQACRVSSIVLLIARGKESKTRLKNKAASVKDIRTT